MRNKQWGLTVGIALIVCAVIALLAIQIIYQVGYIRSGAKADPGVIAQVVANAVAMTGLIIAFLTLRARLDTNRIQVDSLVSQGENQRVLREVELLRHFLDELRSDLDSLTLLLEFRDDKDTPGEPRAFKGKDAIDRFVELFKADQDHTPLIYHPFLRDLYFIIGSFDIFRTQILKATIPPFEKRHLMSRMSFLYTSKLMMGLTALLAASESGKLKINVQTASRVDPAQMLRIVLIAHKKMIDFMQEHQT